jgi:hypothetical protein
MMEEKAGRERQNGEWHAESDRQRGIMENSRQRGWKMTGDGEWNAERGMMENGMQREA